MEDIMKLQKVKTREKEGKKYYRYQITLPKKLVEALDWDPGDDLRAVLETDGIKIKPEEEEG